MGADCLAAGWGHNKMMCLPKAAEAGSPETKWPSYEERKLISRRYQPPPPAEACHAAGAPPGKRLPPLLFNISPVNTGVLHLAAVERDSPSTVPHLTGERNDSTLFFGPSIKKR